MIERARRAGARAHILHLSSSDALPMIAGAKRDGTALSGVVRRAFLRGHEIDGRTPGGKLLRRGVI